jgi:hypothetical protein
VSNSRRSSINISRLNKGYKDVRSCHSLLLDNVILCYNMTEELILNINAFHMYYLSANWNLFLCGNFLKTCNFSQLNIIYAQLHISRGSFLCDAPVAVQFILVYVTGLSSVCWVSLWRRKSTFRWKARPHRSHANGLNPVCLRLWVIRFDDWLNALPHTWHLWGFSPAIKERKQWKQVFCLWIPFYLQAVQIL